MIPPDLGVVVCSPYATPVFCEVVMKPVDAAAAMLLAVVIIASFMIWVAYANRILV